MVNAAALTKLVQPEVVASSLRAVAELSCCCLFGFVSAKRGVLSPTNVSALSQVR
jgi:hypothetical protein